MTTPAPSALATRDLGPAPEREVAHDIIRRGLPVLGLVGFLAVLPWGVEGSASVLIGGAVVLANFWLSAALMAWAARISYGLLAGVALFGFAIRLALVAVTFLVIAGNVDWIERLPMGLTLVIGHLGLLLWETRYVSASLAFPGLKPETT